MTKTPVAPNLALYFQLQPNITRLAKDAGISRPAIYRITYGTCTPAQKTVEAFNAALARLLRERMAMAKKLTAHA